ncbi:glycosyltransferase 87 family protein [Galbibacter sp. EGI 63066]|uniref:glycosyltransferase 87 family protein n=1 Tax=Galbibacter sp. EGI 63066 TaxID=2993559 RepID=UPI002B052E43|nr:glycosyltransferase 87 family protein [Galbibacter sp. EGI 63066]
MEKGNFKFLLLTGILFRLVFIVAAPNLSQDFYRFIWDGRMILEGINPYEFTPQQLFNSEMIPMENYKALLDGMGSLSAGNYSNYPPVHQLFFALAALLGGKSILGTTIVLRVFMIAADLGILYFGRKVLNLLKLPTHQIFWYFLNPFIIIELCGNLHFEGVMLFFLVAALYFLLRKKWVLAAFLLSISISVKLIPLIFLPLLVYWFFKKDQKTSLLKLIAFYAIVIIGFVISFLPFMSDNLISNFGKSIGLWFQKFEFNAGIYYIIREVGFLIKGYNIIQSTGIVLAISVVLIVLYLSFFKKNSTPQTLIISMLITCSFYLFLSTTVHPWYIATPLVLCVFTPYRFPVVWSLVIMISYHAYARENFNENLWLIALEYLVVYFCFIREVILKKPFLIRTVSIRPRRKR